MINLISISIIPLIISIILISGYIKGVAVYDCFVEGAKEGVKSSVKIIPPLIAIFISIGLFKRSGAMDIIVSILSPIGKLMGVPKELMPLFIIKPISGSASLAVLKDIIASYGVDSFIGRTAATMMGSAETIVYTMAVYFGSIGIKNSRHTLPAALISHLAGTIASVVVCSIIFGM